MKKLKKYYYQHNDDVPLEEKYLYLLLYAPGFTKKINEPISGDTWLQKEMHVLSKFIKSVRYDFDEHNFGIFSPSLVTIKAQNTASEMIKQQDEHGSLQLTGKGTEIAEKLWRKTSEQERTVISDLKEFLNDMNYWELIAFSYSTFPDTTSKSEIKPEFQRTRLSAAISLFKRQKVSLSKAATIAGMEIDEFMKELKKRDIPAYSINKTDFQKSLDTVEGLT